MKLFLMPILLAVLTWPAAAMADETIGGACTASTAAAAQSANGNNVVCNASNVWQYPAYQFGSTTATCNSTNAGMVQWTGSYLEFCNGTAWTPTGFYATVMNNLPTTSGTGLSTWVNQSTATVTNAANGIQLSDLTAAAGNNTNALCKTAPSTPYSVIGLISLQANTAGDVWGGLGWRNTTNGKLEIASIQVPGGSQNAGLFEFGGFQYSSPTAWSSTTFNITSANPAWVKLKNDGTTATMYISNDGAAWISAWSSTLSSSYLGSSGYNQICFLMDAATSGNTVTTLMSYQETSP